ncbi:spermidine synthase [Bacillus sp. DTU_2020_1000418_1_SI_GHA_SEK_038]|uniref:spermidine synthase n=1 Tax=Bacillus sp. DTU_2020_1000418_1_SI_GHA_SEK_038 TaxID=3077585 RepID=UPI0028E8811E|nr:spermidine synthase [Bacillus sp. DTU_2020_1000418_1_SI_GHA_SEK_038]WNS76280.1 spermidine synthase [Bacillus sp. DTU_2020_1000418_1_SI_GHA_SEK_038]
MNQSYSNWWYTRNSIRDYISEEEEPEGEYRIIKKINTPTQRIALVDHKGEMLIYSNGYVMFGTTYDDNLYAEALVHIPMSAASDRKKVLIIGGGGGITTREALRYSEVEKITTLDIDEVMIDFGKNLEPLVKFNKGSMNHPKVQTVVEDGRKFIEDNREKWDVIIIDLPEPTFNSLELSRLYSKEYYSLLKDRLKPGGAISVACSAPSWMPEYFWSIQATLKKAGFYVLPYHNFILEDCEDWAFCLATTSPVKAIDLRNLVPKKFLSRERLKDIVHIPLHFVNTKKIGRVQTDSNTVLAEIVSENDESSSS